MSDIEWTDKTWNPMVGCSRVAKGNGRSGCDNCYAEGQVNRFAERYDRPTTIRLGASKRPGLTFVPKGPDGKTLGKGARWTGAVWLLPDVIDAPLRRRKPTTWFVNSQSDVFHESVVGCEVGRRFIAAMFGVMAACPQHTFQILTKRPQQAREWFDWLAGQRVDVRDVTDDEADAPDGAVVRGWERVGSQWFCQVPSQGHVIAESAGMLSVDHGASVALQDLEPSNAWPLPNVWIGASVEDQESADERIPILLDLTAAIRFLSCEPLLGPLNLKRYLWHRWPEDDARGEIDWIIAGGESGPKARECDVAWIESIVDQCKDAGTACFVKQLGAKPVFANERGARNPSVKLAGLDAKGGNWERWPAGLRVREFPEVSR